LPELGGDGRAEFSIRERFEELPGLTTSSNCRIRRASRSFDGFGAASSKIHFISQQKTKVDSARTKLLMCIGRSSPPIRHPRNSSSPGAM
jgi:hypothetical protein